MIQSIMQVSVPVSAIFNPGGPPLYTYNPRNNLRLEEQFNAYLRSGYKLLSISGPTKSGKTVLCTRLLKENERIWISGGEIRDEDDFWCSINDQLDEYNEVCISRSNTQEERVGSEANAEATALLFKGGGKITGEESKIKEESHTHSRKLPPRIQATKVLPKQNKPIVIDDFHYIDPTIQKNIIRALKTPIYEGLRVIIISVPHHSNDVEKAESEMAGRVQHLEIPEWAITELQEIGKSGFRLLNIVHEPLITEMLAKESFGSPQLMHEFCAKICDFNNIEKTSKSPIYLKNYPRLQFFTQAARSITSSSDFNIMKRGPQTRTERKIWEFSSGKKGDIYAAVLIAIANTGPRTSITYDELRAQLKGIIIGELPQKNQVSNVLSQMQDLSSEKKPNSSGGKPKIIEWDNISYTLYLLDPYFAFHLRWLIRNNK